MVTFLASTEKKPFENQLQGANIGSYLKKKKKKVNFWHGGSVSRSVANSETAVMNSEFLNLLDWFIKRNSLIRINLWIRLHCALCLCLCFILAKPVFLSHFQLILQAHNSDISEIWFFMQQHWWLMLYRDILGRSY